MEELVGAMWLKNHDRSQFTPAGSRWTQLQESHSETVEKKKKAAGSELESIASPSNKSAGRTDPQYIIRRGCGQMRPGSVNVPDTYIPPRHKDTHKHRSQFCAVGFALQQLHVPRLCRTNISAFICSYRIGKLQLTTLSNML